ncbi:MAG: hypothetical protein VB142_12040 [Burkholderia sp.]
MPGHNPLVDLSRTIVNADPAVFAPRPRPPALAGLSQTGDQFRSQLVARQGERRTIAASEQRTALSLLKTQLGHRALFTTQVFVDFHRNTTPLVCLARVIFTDL